MGPTREPRYPRVLLAVLAVVLLADVLAELVHQTEWMVGSGRAAIAVAAAWIFFATVVVGVAIACGSWAGRCPHCRRRSLEGWVPPGPPTPDEWARCHDCGATFRRRPGEAWRIVHVPTDDSGAWLAEYLPKLRQTRREMRPDVVPTLDFSRGPDPVAPRLVCFAPPGPPKECRASGHRPDLAMPVILAVIVGGVCLAVLGTEGNTDVQIVAILGVAFVVYSCLMIGWLWHLSGFQALLLTTVTGAILSLTVRVFTSVVNGPTGLALALALILPATPLVIGLLIAGFRGEEPVPEVETMLGRLLRNQRRRRLSARVGPAAKVPLISSSSSWEHHRDG